MKLLMWTLVLDQLRPIRSFNYGRVRPRDTGAEGGPQRLLLSSGVALPGTHVSIRDAGPAEDRVGDVLVAGPQVSPGHWPTTTPAAHQVDTGDIGFIHQGHLFVLGRRDHALVVNGRNLFPEDISAACSAVEGIRSGRTAAFVACGLGEEQESVWLVAEAAAGLTLAADAVHRLERALKRQVAASVVLYVARVRLLPAGRMPVTTSGKVRVNLLRRMVEDGSFARLAPAGGGAA